MSYKPYYTDGWKSGKAGGTPITPEALNHMESGIQSAAEFTYAKKVGAPRNLLDNSDFRNPVNQRGAGGTYGAWGGLTIDRWFASSVGATISLLDSGLQLKGNLGQNVGEGDKFSGKKLTLAVKANGQVYCCSGTVSYIGEWKRIASVSINNVFLDLASNWHTTGNRNEISVTLSTLNGQSIVFEWAALYEGEYTADTLPEYQPKGYAAEMAECCRYFYRIRTYWKYAFTGMCSSATAAEFTIPIPQKMRIEPTMTIPDTSRVKIKCGSMGLQTPSAESYSHFMMSVGNAIVVGVKVSGATAGSAALMYFDNAGTIDFSADL